MRRMLIVFLISRKAFKRTQRYTYILIHIFRKVNNVW